MQVSERYRDELRAIYRARVAESFGHARRCLVKAQRARQDGDRGTQRKWLKHAHILWLAGAGWRLRAQSLAILLAVVLSLSGCARRQTMTLSVTQLPDGSVQWQLTVPEEAWQGLRPAPTGGRTFELDRQTSIRLVAAIDDQLAKHHACPRRWTFGRGLKFRNGTMVFIGQCVGRLVQG